MVGRQAHLEAVRSLREPAPGPAGRSAGPAATALAGGRHRRDDSWLSVARAVLGALPGQTAVLVPVHDHARRLADLEWVAAGPGALTTAGRPVAELLGTRVTEQFPEVVGTGPWAACERVLTTGEPAELITGPLTVRAHRLAGGLLVSWERLDAGPAADDRIASTERLGNLGWGEWDLLSGAVRWSAQLYRIYERDPALGPLPQAGIEALTLPEDRPVHAAAMASFRRGERVDLVIRARIGGRVKFLRTVVDAIRDSAGEPLRVFGIVQDVTAREIGALRLAEAEHQLAEQRRSLAAEHELAARLQRVILPVPAEPLDLPGLKVAVRYLPAGHEDLVGGDWYHAATLSDGSVLLAVGDVAGHGTTAATTMAQLRYSLRALAITTGDPATLLRHLNRLTCDLARESGVPETTETTATAVVARFDPHRHRLTWAQAGHPPPLLARYGRTAPLPRPAGPVLGVLEDARYEAATLDLVVGDLLLCYTDGLVEHRRRGPDDGLASVIRAVDEAVAAAPGRPLGELLSRLRQANPDDDTCIMAVRPITEQTRDLRRFLQSRGRS
ncbi:PP2C family protein-serine/threonine phosphatase [Actinoplanes sp. N902-109]|uniref:PP2C family protein-serine/threonine phosphatase n=1 Tax=Actinoplanes sp. (strain N902-109) TaxID=649831 RepID=UPI0003294CBD|nr:PP2C family protein-serine/threonine phosphatase [Actinoplanes sp. N902-109]AGL17351.1 serine phosphatase RsbU regulator of sigma subunit-like protein [Actinoplanes sp. N902-109]